MISDASEDEITTLKERLRVMRKAFKEVVFQFTPLIEDLVEDNYLDDHVEVAFVKLLRDASAVLEDK